MESKYIQIHPMAPPGTNTVYVVGKLRAKKAKERWPSFTVMYLTKRTNGDWVKYKGE